MFNALCSIYNQIHRAHEHESTRVDLIYTDRHLAVLRQDGGYKGFPCHVLLHDQEAC